MNRNAEILFEYLRNVIYDPQNAHLEPGELDEDFVRLGKGLIYFCQSVIVSSNLASELAKGNLAVEPPSSANEFASSLKSLQAALRHVTWQTQQVAKGDYQQHMDFMGEFSAAFNEMVRQLDFRQRALLGEIEESKKKTMALSQNNELLLALAQRTSQRMFITGNLTKEYLFVNEPLQKELDDDPDFLKPLFDAMKETDLKEGGVVIEYSHNQLGKVRYFSTAVFPIQWQNEGATTYIISDNTSERRQLMELENFAYVDSLTGVGNRFAGMKELKRLLENKSRFCLCFCDLNKLKYINDTFGHGEGDIYISTVANELSAFSSNCSVYRLGGDEFMLLAPGYSEAQSQARLEEICEEISRFPERNKKPYEFSLSYGIVDVPSDNILEASELLEKADDRMYMHKKKLREIRKKGL